MPADVTLEEIWKLFQETGQRFRETDEKFRETAPKFREMDHSLDDLEAIVARTSRNVDNLIGEWSKFLEGMVVPACKSLFADRSIPVHKVLQSCYGAFI